MQISFGHVSVTANKLTTAKNLNLLILSNYYMSELILLHLEDILSSVVYNSENLILSRRLISFEI